MGTRIRSPYSQRTDIALSSAPEQPNERKILFGLIGWSVVPNFFAIASLAASAPLVYV